ncbi:MAG TPA: transglutaminase domain-containing protein [Terracidiphilus sp.]|nr:transglutaminase domain-containing protein [Terracidiphilus sp.]
MRFHDALPLAFLLAVGSVPLVARAQFPPVLKEELAMTSDSKVPGAAAVYLYREETEDDPHSFRTIYARIKVLNADGKSAAVVHVSFPQSFVFNAVGTNSSRMSGGFGGSLSTQSTIAGPNTAHWDMPSINHTGEDQPWDTDSYVGKVEVAALEGRVTHADGTVVPLAGKTLELLKVSKGPRGSETTFTMPGVEVGSVIEYRYQIRYDRYLTAPDWELQEPYYIHKEHFVFRPSKQFLPQEATGVGVGDSALKDAHDNILTDIHFRPVLPSGKTLTRDAMGNYSVDLTDVPAIPQEPFAPPQNAEAFSVDFYYTYTFDVKDYWQKQMSYWTRALNAYTASNQALQKAVKDSVAPSDSPLEKAKKLYAFVQTFQNTDSSPDGAPLTGSEWIPRGKVDSVLQTKRGSSNQIAYLYLALLRAARITARPERIASRSLHIFSAQYMDNLQLDTVLVALEIDGKEILVDPGTKMAPFEALHWAHTGAGGVAMDANSKTEIIVTPLQKITDNSTLHIGTVNVSPKGVVSGSLKVAFIGQKAIELRQLGVKSGVEAVQAEISSVIAQQVPAAIHIAVDHVGYLDDPDRQLLAVILVSGSFSKQSDGRLVLPRTFFEAQEQNPFPAETSRELPVDMRYPAQEQEQITYALPPGFALAGTPEDAKLKWEGNAAYELRTKVEGSSITDARVFVRAFTVLDAKDYGQLHDFYQKVVAADQQPLVLAGEQVGEVQ